MRQRVGILIIALAAASTCWSRQEDPMQKRITLDLPATTAKNLMPILQKETGVAFNVTPQTANDVLLISVKDVPLSQLMERIADIDNAEWTKDSTGYRLIRSQGLANKYDREYLAARAGALANSIAKLKNPPATTAKGGGKTSTEQIGAVMTFDNGNGPQEMKLPAAPKLAETPIGRALIRVLSTMNANDLASISEGGRVVFATNPTRMQRALLGTAVRELQGFAAEHQKYVQSKQQAETEINPAKFIFFGTGAQTSNEIKGGIQKFFLIFERYEDSDDLQVTLQVADNEGNIAASSSALLSGRIENDVKPLTVDGNEKAIELSDEAKLHAKLMTQDTSGPQMKFRATAGNNMIFTVKGVALGEQMGAPVPVKATPELYNKILYPEKYDPLSFAASEFIKGLSQGENSNLVASLPDSILIPLSRRAATNTRPSDLKNFLMMNLDMTVVSKDGWTTVSPNFSALSRFRRTDRFPLGLLLRGVNGKQSMSLDQAAAFAIQRNQPLRDENYEIPYVNVINKTASSTLNGLSPYNWSILQLYGSMGIEQRRNMLQYGAVRAGSLSVVQASIFNRMIYQDPGGPQFIDPNPPKKKNNQEQKMTATIAMSTGGGGTFMNFGDSKLIHERTELLPNGVPGDAMLNLKVDAQEAVLAMSADGERTQFMSPDEYAIHNMMASQDQRYAADLPKYTKFMPATITNLNFEFKLSQYAQMHRDLDDNSVLPNEQAVPYDRLPASFKSKADAAFERMKAKMNSFGGGAPIIGGGKKPPLKP